MAKVKGRKRKIILGVVFIALFFGLLAFMFSGDNKQILIDIFVKDIPKDEMQEHLSQFGWKGYITIGLLSMMQVVFTFVPAEPIQVVAGISFGLWRGILCCFAGVLLGNTLIYVLYKLYGDKLSEYFDKKLDINFAEAASSKRVALIIIIMGLLPAIPYGLICFFASTLKMKYPRYILVTGVGALPSIALDVALGHIAIASSWIISIIVLVVLIVLLIIMAKKRKVLFAKVNAFIAKSKKPYSSATKAQKVKPSFVKTILFFAGFHFKPKMKIKIDKKVDKIERPSIILINHGSFVDFYYTGLLLKDERANFISNRMYFYKKFFGKNMARVGCFPKSMFQSDMENAKNCLRVLSRKGVLAFMPEARLSTVGKFEGIQDSTYKFVHRAGVAVYSFVLHGDYFARPKWGDKIRKGSLVEGEFKQMLTAEQVKSMSVEEVQKVIDDTLYYDEFEWIKSKPDIRYKSKTLAVGLENILTRCPSCGARYSFTTDKRTLTCSACSLTATLDDRYSFVGSKPFENFSKWYDWQKAQFIKEIEENPDLALESKVKLKHSSKDGKTMLRDAGEGECRFTKEGLTYKGTDDGEEIEKFFPMKNIYRLLFGAGEDFELYEGEEIWYFVPDELRSCVDWYTVSEILRTKYDKEEKENEKGEGQTK